MCRVIRASDGGLRYKYKHVPNGQQPSYRTQISREQPKPSRPTVFSVPQNMSTVYSAVSSTFHAAAWLTFYLWLGLLVYNIISALFGIGKLRRLYVELLRQLYRVSDLH